MTIIGSAYVDIRAITDHLEADIKKALATLPKNIDIKVDANTTAAEDQIDLLVAWADLHKVDVTVHADTAMAETEIDAMAARTAEAVVNVDADTAAARAHVDEFIHEEDGRNIDVPVDVDESVALTKMAILKAKLEIIAHLKPIMIPVAVGNGEGPIKAIGNALRATSSELSNANLKLTWFGEALKTAGGHATTSGNNIGTFLNKLSGFDGLVNLTKAFIDLKINLGSEVPAIALTAEKIGAMSSTAMFAAGNILSLGSSLVSLAGVAVALPGVFVGLEIAMKLTSIAFGDLKKGAPDLAKEMQALKDMITQDFWSQARSGLQSLIGPTSVLREEIGKTSTVLGKFWGTMFEGMSKGSFAKAMSGDFDNLNNGIKIITNSSATFLHIFQTLGEFGSAYIPKLAQGLVDVSARFDAFLTHANADGTLKRWVDNGVEAFHGLMSVISNTAAVIGGLMKAATDAGGASLGMLGAAMERFAAVIRDPAVQTALVNLFSGANIMMKEAVTGLGNFLGAIGWLSPALKNVEENVGLAIQTILTFFGQIIANPAVFKGIQDLFRGITEGLQAFSTATGPLGDKLGIFMTIVGEVAASLGTVFADAATKILPAVKDLLLGIEPIIKPLGEITMAIVDALAPALNILIKTAFPPLIALITGAVLPALAKLVPIIGTMLPPLMVLLGDAIAKIAPILKSLIEHLTPVIEKLLEVAMKAIPPIVAAIVPLVDGFSQIIEAILPIVSAILDFVSGLLDIKPVAETITGIITAIVAAMIIYNTVIGIAAVVTAIMEAPVIAIVIGVGLLIAGIVLLITHWGDVTKAISDFITSSGLGEWVNQTIGMFADFGKNTLGMFADFFKNTAGMFVDFFNNTVGMFVDFFNNTVGMFADFGSRLWSGITDVWNGIIKIIGDVIGNVISFVQEHWGLIVSFITGPIGLVIQWIVEHWNEITKVFADVWKSIVDGVTGAINFVRDIISNVTNFIGNMWKEFWEGRIGQLLMAVMNLIRVSIEWVFAWIGTFIKNSLDFVSTVWNTVWKAVGDFFTTIWNNIVSFVTTVFTNIVNFIKDRIDTMYNNIKAALDFVFGIWNKVWGDISKVVSDVWNIIVNWVKGKITEVHDTIEFYVNLTKAVWEKIWDAISSKVSEIWNAIVSWVTGKITEIHNTIEFYINLTKAVWEQIWTAISDKVSEIWNAIVSWVTGKITEIHNTIEFYINLTKAIWEQIWNAISDKVKEIWQGIVDGITTFVQNVVDKVTGVKDKITGFFNGAKDWLFNSGKSIIQGLIDGINHMIDDITRSINDVAKIITDHMPHSPAKKGPLSGEGYTLTSGKAIVRDLAGGMMSQIGDVESAANALAAAARPKYTGPANIFAGSVSGSPDVFVGAASAARSNGSQSVVTPTINVYPSAPLNEEQVGRMAASQLFWEFTNR